jgi:hypothetical protein
MLNTTTYAETVCKQKGITSTSTGPFYMVCKGRAACSPGGYWRFNGTGQVRVVVLSTGVRMHAGTWRGGTAGRYACGEVSVAPSPLLFQA